MKPIYLLPKTFDVTKAVEEIDANPSIWNRHTLRTDNYSPVHREVSDCWVRYNAWDNFHGDAVAFNNEHESSWYPVADELPSLVEIVYEVLKFVKGGTLGGVLMTRIPPGGSVKPHIDTGWHAGHYTKFCVQIKGNKDQAFVFDDARLSAEPGELYTFRNDVTHSVENNSDSDRISLIICVRGTDYDFAG